MPNRAGGQPQILSILLGIFALLFFVAHGWYHYFYGDLRNLLWTCNLGTLFVGVGMLLGISVLNSLGLYWVILGAPLWVGALFTGEPLLLTSIFTHFGTLAIGLFGITRLGLPNHMWLKAAVALLLLFGLSRVLTPAELNINLAWSIWPWWRRYISDYSVYFLMLFSFCMVIFVFADLLLRRFLVRKEVGQSPAEIDSASV